jgi:hypothetical protein
MRNLKLQQAARERARKIREYAAAFRRELELECIAQLHTKALNKQDVGLNAVTLPTRKSQQRRAA